MLLKRNETLKIFALLLFSFELLAPVFLSSPTEKIDQDTQHSSLHGIGHQFNMMACLCEEASNEEERGGKDHKAQIFSFELRLAELFSPLEKLEGAVVYADPSLLRISKTSLITLLGSYRI